MDLLELQLRIKEGVAQAFPGKYWVKAEISSWSPRANGHCYLSLSQSRGGKSIAESRAMIWNWQFPRVKYTFEQATGQPLQAGITVLVRVQVNFSELYGISLFIDNIDPAFTLGEKAWNAKGQ
jgi:exodeoxyribonuclease VII large subunit